LVPQAVLDELQHPEAPSDVRDWASAPPAWFEKRDVEQIDVTLVAELGAGERQAISLALEVHADVLLIDERAGRQEAEARHIEVAGTLAVLLQASLRGYFEFPQALSQLRQYGFRASKAVEAVMLARYQKTKKLDP
jgi:predicted nucleic acid-binding protein